MKEEITWVHIIHYYWQNENGEIYDKIWTSKDYRRSKLFFEIRKDMLLNRGVNINTVARCAGHQDIKITRSYYATLQEATVIKEVKQAMGLVMS